MILPLNAEHFGGAITIYDNILSFSMVMVQAGLKLTTSRMLLSIHMFLGMTKKNWLFEVIRVRGIPFIPCKA
jgi:hypothetical protein